MNFKDLSYPIVGKAQSIATQGDLVFVNSDRGLLQCEALTDITVGQVVVFQDTSGKYWAVGERSQAIRQETTQFFKSRNLITRQAFSEIVVLFIEVKDNKSIFWLKISSVRDSIKVTEYPELTPLTFFYHFDNRDIYLTFKVGLAEEISAFCSKINFFIFSLKGILKTSQTFNYPQTISYTLEKYFANKYAFNYALDDYQRYGESNICLTPVTFDIYRMNTQVAEELRENGNPNPLKIYELDPTLPFRDNSGELDFELYYFDNYTKKKGFTVTLSLPADNDIPNENQEELKNYIKNYLFDENFFVTIGDFQIFEGEGFFIDGKGCKLRNFKNYYIISKPIFLNNANDIDTNKIGLVCLSAFSNNPNSKNRISYVAGRRRLGY